jgi:protein-disulfide isomerase/uncharacterized membrane protein
MRTNNRLLLGVLVLSVLGFLISIWLLTVHMKYSTGQATLTESCNAFVKSSHGCATIAVSNFSRPLGIPLAAIAMGYYFSLLLLVVWAWRIPQTCYEPLYVAFLLATLSIPVTVLMAFIARTQLNSFCLGCAELWTINLLVWPLLVKHLGLGWGNALASLTELINHKNLRLSKSRIKICLSIALASVVVFSVIGFAAESMQSQASMYGAKDRAISEYKEGTVVFLNQEMLSGPNVKGPDAPLMDIVEFSDLQCPACKMAAQYFKPFLLKNAKEVRFSYLNFPLDGACNAYAPNGMHRYGCAAARAVICAGKQGKFFEYHDQVFDNQENLSEEFLVQAANNLGLEVNAFTACQSDPQTEALLQKNIEWGNSVKVEFTPTIIVNGHKLGSAMAPAQLEALLDYLRAERSK